MLKRFTFLAAAIVVASCSRTAPGELSRSQRQQIENAVKEQLKDPASAQFDWDRIIVDIDNLKGTGLMCLPVNAKNSFGGYTGFQLSYLFFGYRPNYPLHTIQVFRVGSDKAVLQLCTNLADNIISYKKRDPRLSEDQARAGCYIYKGKVACDSPGTGMCWEKGHNPEKGESPSLAIDAKHDDLCSK